MTFTPQRLDAIDSAKGIGILLVVFGHAWRGARAAGLLADDALFRGVDFAVYAFHMPLFFFLSGLLFLETLQKYDVEVLLRGRFTRLLWPMALWSWIFFGLKLSAGRAANNPVMLSDFPIIPLPPYEHLWFLWALFLCQSLLILLYAPFGARLPVAVLGYMLGTAAVGLALVNPYVAVPSLIWGPMVEHIPYFFAGIAVGGVAMARPNALAGVFSGLFFAGLLATVGLEKASVLKSLLIVLTGWLAWFALDRNGNKAGPILGGFRYLGQASMVIYLTHTVFSATLRIVMLKFGVDGIVPVLVATTAIGVLAPLAVLWTARRFRLVKSLGF